MTLFSNQEVVSNSVERDLQSDYGESTDQYVIEEYDRIVGLRRGDDLSYEWLVRTYTPKLLTVARRYLDEDDARDAVQETFIKSFESIHTFQGNSSLSTWLHRITVNCSLGKLRKSKSKSEVSIESLLPSFLDDGHRVDPMPIWPEHCVERLQSQSLVAESINKIPYDFRIVIILRDIEGFNCKETAETLGITINLVKVRLHRARQALRELLDPIVHSL